VDDLTLTAGDARLRIATGAGGRLAGLRVNGLDLLGRGGPGLYHWGCYPMAPFAGRIRRGRLTWQGRTHQLPITYGPHAIHGVTVDRPWTVLGADTGTARLGCDFDNRWPWRGRVQAEYTLTEQGLTGRLQVHATDRPMPAWIGWHPWFTRRLSRGDPARIDFEADALLVKDVDGIPAGEAVPVPDGPYDDCFSGVSWPATICWDGAIRLSVSSDAANLVVYDELPDAVCVEPQTGPPDAVALGRHTVVEPGTPLTVGMRWSWTPDEVG
jgi:aldose 1-epimerase